MQGTRPRSRPGSLCLLALLAAALGLPRLAAAGGPRRPPNVVIILADDQGWGDLSLTGNTQLSTPRIDSLARDGALVEHFYVEPLCSPTRAELLTGRYAARGGVRNVTMGGERLDLDERTLAESFRAAGYATGAFGKWHNGLQSPYHPTDRGFDEFYGFCSGHWGDYFDAEVDRNGRITRGRGFMVDDLTNRALRFIEKNRGRPFLCYLPVNTPHSPMQVPDRFWESFKDREIRLRATNPAAENVGKTRAALAMCEDIDWNVGRVLDRLERLKLAQDTIVLYFSDNGPNGARWNGGMKGVKGQLDEGGMRSPLVIRWPGRIRPGTRVSRVAGAVDLYPTLLDLAGVKRVGAKPLDGRSLKPLLLGERPAWPDRTLVSYWAGRVSLRTQKFRLDPQGRLYDLEADPGQKRDAAAEHPQDAERLRTAARRWKAELDGELGPDTRPFTVGYSKSTPLPARDGVPEGGVRRSGRAPNCSYFTNWTKTADRMTWHIQVARGGVYDAAVYYACPQKDLGARVELSFGDARIERQVDQAYDPPLVGQEHDRVPRVDGESYVKDFRPFRLDSFRLKPGRGLLTLRALEIPGSQAMEVRYVILTRRD